MAAIALYAFRAYLMPGLLKELQQAIADYQAGLFSPSAKSLTKRLLLGQLIGGGFAAGLTAFRGRSLTEIVESFFDGAFLGGYGAMISSALTMSITSRSPVRGMAIGGVSAGLGGAITAGILYVMCNGLNFKGGGSFGSQWQFQGP